MNFLEKQVSNINSIMIFFTSKEMNHFTKSVDDNHDGIETPMR